ncbi:MAG: hypothetical protein IJW29_04535 [Clostridia bacterium]|nr:hypothetical protein [Clostridia bacterium]
MYEYAPKFEKKKEKRLTALVLVVGLLIYFVSYIPNVPYGVLFQIAGICGMAAMILLFSLVVARNYVYTVKEDEEGELDFIITEFYGKRRTVVCRVSVSSIRMAIPCNEETQAQLASEKNGKRLYNYTGVLFDEERYCLKIVEGGETFLVKICANKDLIFALTNH